MIEQPENSATSDVVTGISDVKVKRKFGYRLFRFLRKLLIILFVISIAWVIIDWFTPIYVTPLMFIRSVESVAQGEMPKNSKQWVSIDNISPNMIQAVVASEDNLFLTHHGFSINDMTKAFEHNLNGKKIRGGSTISQQTAKNVFLFPQRSYIRKGLEAYYTVLIELVWSKKRIMEAYLNVIEMGDGIYGVEAAAQEYFGVHASELTKSQAALIAACLPNPRKFNAGNPSGYILGRKNQIVNLMGKLPQVDFDKRPVSPKQHKKHRRK
ncbi:monofunctional biosynthetic peptidoglycan transglycosylase [Paludibacter propionicigenes WB4]|uniref:Biosynthetic peptidoglycan transglycosylase n=1 Tax=Paludibacter propionicigenes (strain DSM 17365 / JCM 13257 / WB4) TaxID=694427 RepID=E4T0G3_PALPW|nr:monofunctional biosynthetic peptidoglycan transglycosylase [Paludibacter propionicigenes]ADQ78322.1 monofunctional biosynthetic peptidoglycan transglycosylase [Paludibacter propionicigenes WB4]